MRRWIALFASAGLTACAAPAFADDTLNGLFALTGTTTVNLSTGNVTGVSAAPGSPTTQNGGAFSTNIVAGLATGQTWSQRSAISFSGVGSTVQNQQIVNATLMVYRTAQESSSAVTSVYRMTSPFITDISGTPSGVSDNRMSSACCTPADADNAAFFNQVIGGPLIFNLPSTPATGGYVSIDVTSIVKAWQTAGYSNAYGFGFRGIESSATRQEQFMGFSGLNPPILQITFESFMTPEPGSIAIWAAVAGIGAAIGWRTRRKRLG